MKALLDSQHFPIWCMNFEGQLRKIHEEFVSEDGHTFHDLPFTDFCLLAYTEMPDMIDISQNWFKQLSRGIKTVTHETS